MADEASGAPEWATKMMDCLDEIRDRVDRLEHGRDDENPDEDEHEDLERADESEAQHEGHVEAGKEAAETRKRDDSFDGLVHKLEGEGKSSHYAKAIAGKVNAEKHGDYHGGRKDADEGDDKEEAREDADGSLPPIQPVGHGGRHRKDADEEEEHEAGEELAKARDDVEGFEEGGVFHPIRGSKDYKRTLAGDPRRKPHRHDSDEDEDRVAFADAQLEVKALRKHLRNVSARMDRAFKPLTIEERNAISAARARADSVAQLYGDVLTDPLAGESPIDYRRRMASQFQAHSAEAKGIDLHSLDGKAFKMIEDRIYADAQAAALAGADANGTILETRHTDATGRVIRSYVGNSIVPWAKPFMARGTRFTIAAPSTFHKS